MKKSTFIFAIAASLFAFVPATKSFAKNDNKSKKAMSTSNTSIVVSNIAYDNEYVLLNIQLNQSFDKSATVRITDAHGEVLYTERFNEKTHNMLVKVDPMELSRISVELSSGDGFFSREYKVEVKTAVTAMVQDVSSK